LPRIPRDAHQELPPRPLAPAARHPELRTLGVELRIVRRMQRQQLMPDEVVPRRQARGDLGRPLLRARNVTDRPALALQLALLEPGVLDLEPPLAAAVAGREGAAGWAGVHVHGDGTLLVLPLVPLGGEGCAGADWGREGGGGAAVAPDFGVGDAADGVEGGPLALDCLRALLGRVAVVAGGRWFGSGVEGWAYPGYALPPMM
jgi:hypothetical protein